MCRLLSTIIKKSCTPIQNQKFKCDSACGHGSECGRFEIRNPSVGCSIGGFSILFLRATRDERTYGRVFLLHALKNPRLCLYRQERTNLYRRALSFVDFLGSLHTSTESIAPKLTVVHLFMKSSFDIIL